MTIFIIIAVLIIAVVIQLVLSHRQVGKVTACVLLSASEAEPDEKFYITIKIDNPTWAIYPFLRFSIIIPQDIEVHSPLRTVSRPPSSAMIIGSCVLLPKRSVERKIEISAPSRGLYRFGTFTLTAGDFLGLKEYSKDYSGFCCIAVYPKAEGAADISQTLGGTMGDYSVRRFIFEDPVLISGFREYTGTDPMKSISWLQSARTGQLMVKQFDHTSQMSATVVLDTENANEQFEKCFSFARSVCDFLEENAIEYDFFLNAVVAGISDGRNYMVKGLGSNHYFGILKQLAVAHTECAYSGLYMADIVCKEIKNTSQIIYISGQKNENTDAVLARLRENPLISVSEIYVKEEL